MSVKKLIVVLAIFNAVFFSMIISCAEESIFLLQECAWEQKLDIYIMGDIQQGDLLCKVSNQEAEVIGSGYLADRKVTVRTTILIDISKSMPVGLREDISLCIDKLIENLKENEQCRLITFGEQVNLLQDFTSDRYDLVMAVDKIEFDSQQTGIYDAIYNTIPEIQLIDGNACYYRTVLITDGIDDTLSGITKEELYLKLQANTYPIDVIAVSEEEQTDADKELAALVRMSNGRYANLYKGVDLQEFVSKLSVSEVFWMRVVVPGNLLDGSTRQINVSDGMNSLQFDVKVPIFDSPFPTDRNEVESTFLTDEDIQATIEPQVTEQLDREKQIEEEKPESYFSYAYIGVLLLVIVSLVVVVAVRIRKKKEEKVHSHSPKKIDTIGQEETEMILDKAGSIMDGFYVRLHDVQDPDRNWNVSLSQGIIIGRREDSQVYLADRSVSHQQCRIYLLNGIPVVENISQANITRLNGELVSVSKPIKEGDKLKCGRITIMIDLLYKANQNDGDKLTKKTEFVNV